MATSPYLCYGDRMESSVEWNPVKDEENRRKHGVSFAEAQLAFMDAQRVIARDIAHSKTEPRYYCFGRMASGVLTARFAGRGGVIRIIGAGFWRRGKKIHETQRKISR